MDDALHADARGSEHALLRMEDGVIRQISRLMNPRPLVGAAQAGAGVPVRPPHPILTNAQLRLNIVLARRTPSNQAPGTFARVSSLMLKEDVQSGSALFFALRQKKTDATICDLVDMNPLALTMVDTDDHTPLMVALLKQRSFRVVQHMVLKNRDVVMYTMDNGMYPLLIAIQNKSDARSIAILVDENGELLRRRNSSDVLPVCAAIKAGYNVDVLKLLVYPDCPDIYDRPPASTHELLLPLHMALQNEESSLQVVEFLVQQNNAALLMTDHRGMTALHLAAGRRPAQSLNVQVIQFLAQQAPAARTVLSLSGKSPFRLAVSSYHKSFKCRNLFDDMAAILLALRDEDETVLMQASGSGFIPLMKACVFGAMVHPAVFRVLIGTKHATTTMTDPYTQKTALHRYVNSMGHHARYAEECMQLLCANDVVLTMRDHKGRTPLLISLQHRTNTMDWRFNCWSWLAPIAYPGLLEMADNDGNLPLQLAILGTAGDEVLARLMGCKLVTCKHRNKQNNRAIDLAMRAGGVDMARMSLFMFPGIDLAAPGNQNRTLLHVALQHSAHPTVIAHLLQVGPSMLGVKSNNDDIPLMTAIAATTRVGVEWQPTWSDKMIRSLAAQTHAASAASIPSCRSILREKTKDGRSYRCYEGHSVLHIALKGRRPLSVVRCILDLDVAVLLSAYMADDYSYAASEHYDEDFHDRQRQHRVTKLLAFHHALWYAADINILKYLAEKHPRSDLFELTDRFKNTALHMAIRQQRRGERVERGDLPATRGENPLPVCTVRYLIHAGEMALLTPDEHGNTPLHLAIAVGSNAEIMQLLIEACTPPAATYENCVRVREMPCESAFLMQNSDLRSPLHLAMQHTESTAPLAFLMRPCPQAMLIRDKDGCTPMHLMMSVHVDQICPAKVLELLEMVPEVLLMQDTLGRTPLHTLLENMTGHKYRDMREDWQQLLTQHLTGVTAGLLPRTQTKRLMMLGNAANQCPLQYYLANFVNEHRRNHTPYLQSGVGRELRRANACA